MSLRFVLDASLTLAWCFEDEKSKMTERVLDALLDGEAIVPAIWKLEILNVLLCSERRGRLTRAESEQFLTTLDILSIVVDDAAAPGSTERILSLGRDYQLASYDAAYLELAIREGLPIATIDTGMRRAMIALRMPQFTGT
ncbi:MAG: type II toxin-antitoxin system VapC family toxin [Armatimonadota bacterium]